MKNKRNGLLMTLALILSLLTAIKVVQSAKNERELFKTMRLPAARKSHLQDPCIP